MTWRGMDSADRRPGTRQACPDDAKVRAEPPAALRAAAKRAAAAARQWVGEGATPEDAAELLVALSVAVAGGADGLVDPRLRTHLGRRLLDEFRAALIRGWSEGAEQPPAGEVLESLKAVETVRATIEPDWVQHFGSRLSGPDGLRLVVEVAHDLRSPLTSILFLAELLMNGQSGEVNDLQRRQLGLVYSAALGLSELASNVIEVARAGDRLAEPELAAFSVRATLESVLDITRPMAEEKGLTIRTQSPASDQRLGYPLALNRALLNLTTNAIKFTEEGFVEISVREREGSTLQFSVRDTGRGMNPEALETLYAPFRRVAGEDRYAFSGTGLGLALTKRLVEVMGSELAVSTKPGWGTRFSFCVAFPRDERPLHGLTVENRPEGLVMDVDIPCR